MRNYAGIVHITNFEPRRITDGGILREEALGQFLAARGAVRIIVQDQPFRSSKMAKFGRLNRLIREIRGAHPGIVVLSYPGYPFFWEHRVTRYLLMSLLFTHRLRAWANDSNARIIIDVTDLPLYQYEDLGLPMKMSPGHFAKFDRCVFSSADELWVCSFSLAKLIRERYGLPEQVIKTVVNGSTVREYPSARSKNHPFRFVYCGGLIPHRGTADMISSFIDARIPDAQLHLSGTGGEWINNVFKHPQVIYHGQMNNNAAQGMTARCNVGLIYYPQRGYYHYAFATKLAHYIGCGLPVICTDVRETGEAVKSMGVGVVADISQFGDAMRDMARGGDPRVQYAKALAAAKRELSWEHIFASALGETAPRTNAAVDI